MFCLVGDLLVVDQVVFGGPGAISLAPGPVVICWRPLDPFSASLELQAGACACVRFRVRALRAWYSSSWRAIGPAKGRLVTK